jgi:hypothetical protein
MQEQITQLLVGLFKQGKLPASQVSVQTQLELQALTLPLAAVEP